ncbi:MAG: O-antigen ligase family protein [Anaerolineae bacterium]|nr:O-antigen ligase family protein [Anaerolineae bacterium]
MSRAFARQDLAISDTVLQIIVAIMCGLALGLLMLIAPPTVALLLIAGGFFLVIALKRPELFILSLIMITSTAVPATVIPVVANIGPGRVFLTDLIFLLPFGLIILRAIVERDFRLIGTPLDVPLLLFVALVFLVTLLGFSRTMPYQMSIRQVFASPPLIISLAIPEIRVIAYYLVFFSVTNLIRTENQLDWLLKGLNGAALVTGMLIIIQAALPGISLLQQVGRVERLLTEGSRYNDITRVVDLPGEALIFMMFSVVLANLLHRQPARIRDWLLLVPLGIAIIFTFNRNFWVSIGMAVFILAYLGDRIGWQRFTVYGLGGALLLGLAIVISLSMPESKLGRLTYATGERVVSLVKPTTYTEGSSIQFRVIETQYALQQIDRRPVFGVGLGGYYRPYDSRLDWEYFDGRGYIHNGHLWLILKSGFAGYLCFLWLSIAFIVRSFRRWRSVRQLKYRSVLLGFVIIYLGVAFAAVVNPIYMQSNWTPLIGLMMGINEVILRFSYADDGESDDRKLWYIYSIKQGERAGVGASE